MPNREIEEYLQSALNQAEAAIELSQLIEGYSLCARSEGLSENTILLARRSVGYLRVFLAHSGLPTQADLIGVGEIRRFILHLKEVRRFQSHPLIRSRDGKLTSNTISCYLRSLSAFWGWLVREELVYTNPFTKVKIPKTPKKRL